MATKTTKGVRFTGELLLGGKTATGFEVPEKIVTTLGTSKRPAVRVTIGKHVYRSTVAPMGGRFMLPVSAENREKAGIAAGDTVEVVLELDTAPREVTVPKDLAAALKRDAEAKEAFEALSFSRKNAYVVSVEGAKTTQTRERRIAKTIAALRAG